MARAMTATVLFGLLSLLANSNALPSPNDDYQFKVSAIEPSIDQDSLYDVAEHYVNLDVENAKSSSSSLAARSSGARGHAKVQSLLGSNYYIPIEFGGQHFKALVDTGASDTWVASSNLTCVDEKGKPRARAKCRFPRYYHGTFQYKQIPNQNFYVPLGLGEFTQGPVGYADVKVAGLQVKKQQVALVTKANFDGYGIGSGILGLAYPGQTQVYHGTNHKNNTPRNRAEYPPIFTRMFSDGLIKRNLFSLALNRGSSTKDGGTVAFGGLPPIPFNKTDYGQTKILAADLSSRQAAAKKDYTFYTIVPKAFGLTGGKLTKNTDYFLINAGTPGIFLPSKEAAKIAKAFKPPAKLMGGPYIADCDAVPPKFSVQIGEKEIAIDPRDMIFRQQHIPGVPGKCLTGLYDGGKGPYTLGDVFLTNVVAVFDVGAAELIPATVTEAVAWALFDLSG